MLPALILVTLGSMLILYILAGRRGANRTFRVTMGLLFGPLAIPFVFFAGKKD